MRGGGPARRLGSGGVAKGEQRGVALAAGQLRIAGNADADPTALGTGGFLFAAQIVVPDTIRRRAQAGLDGRIAGLGKAPVTVFVMLILLFAILVGPVNFMILRRRKKPLLALLTVPLAGFGTTFGILAYGLFHDGLGARGVITTCTLLDQTSHEAVSLQARTLFAGVAPSDMTTNPGTLVLSLRAGLRNRDVPDRWIFHADAQQLDGGGRRENHRRAAQEKPSI